MSLTSGIYIEVLRHSIYSERIMEEFTKGDCDVWPIQSGDFVLQRLEKHILCNNTFLLFFLSCITLYEIIKYHCHQENICVQLSPCKTLLTVSINKEGIC